MVEEEQRVGDLTQHFQILVEELWQTALWRMGAHSAQKTDTRNSNTQRLQLKQTSPAFAG